jgi:hypothetical protein
MHIRFARGKEAGSKHYGFRAERQRGDHSARVRDAASYGDRKWRYRIHDSRRQYHGGDLTLDVTTSLGPLRDYDIHAGGGGAPGRFHRSNLQEDLAAGGMYPFDISRRIAPEERNDRNVLLQGHGQVFLMRQGKDEIHAERLVCGLSHALYLFAKIRRRTKLSLH